MDETPPFGTYRTAPWDPTKAETYDVTLKAQLLFPPETNDEVAWRVLAKWLKHLSKHNNKTADKRLSWHAISNHQTVIKYIPPRDAQNVKYV